MRASSLPVILLSLAVATPAAAQRLPGGVTPEHYDLRFAVDLQHQRFEGVETIDMHVAEPFTTIVLNALEIDFGAVRITAGGQTQSARVSIDAEHETAALTVERRIPAGAASVHITYSAALNRNLRGFYLSKGRGRNYAVTQFESTDARRAFPCFDEPALKATFRLTLVVDRDDTAISNGKITSDRPGPGPSQHTLTFSETPKMSTYLVAMAVGDFQCLDGGADGVPIRICATPDKKALGRIALESAEQILRFYDRYYAIAYPFGKLDVVAVPDFAAGAMENTAAIFYRETDLLAESGDASVKTRKTVASVLAHEMAHQWFGDLVTMQWWDDLWLNEGFATWMANHPLAAWKPEWNVPVDEAEENQVAMNVDSLANTRPIHTAVDTPAQIEEAFDAIAYQKGAAVLRMIEHYVGAEPFRAGVNAYLKAHAYGNATEADFWSAIAAASGKPVDTIMPTFVNQPGVPLVDVDLSCESGKTAAHLRAERFFLDASPLKKGTPEQWRIPVCVKAQGGSGTACEVLGEAARTIAVDSGSCAPWVFANVGAEGYYRTAYQPGVLRALSPQIEAALTAPERLSLTGDAWALVRAGRYSVADYLTLATGLGRERADGVLANVTSRLGFIDEYLTTDATRDRFEAWVRTLLRPGLDAVGAATTADEARALRATLVASLGNIGQDHTVISEARAQLEHALSGGPRLDPAMADAVVAVAASHGDRALYDALESAAAKATSPDDQYRYLYALTDFRDPALIDRTLRFTLTAGLRSQDAALYLGALIGGNEAARPRAWSFIKAHWNELEPKITISNGDVNLLTALSAFCDAGSRDDIRAFFTVHKLPTSARTLGQTLERIDNCIVLKQGQEPVLGDWLGRTATGR